jgi:hypothetical protein
MGVVRSILLVSAIVAALASPARAGVGVTWEPSDVRVTDPDAQFPGGQKNMYEPTIAIDPTDPSNVLAFALDFSVQNHNADQYSVVRGYRSQDGGGTWTDTGVVRYDPSDVRVWDGGDPVVAFAPSGEAYLATLGYPPEGDVGVYIHRSADGGATWQRPVLAVAPNRNPDDDTCGAPDKEWLTVDERTGVLYLTYSEFRERCTAIDPVLGADQLVPTDIGVYLKTSADGGRTWSEPQRLWTAWALGAIPKIAPDGTIHVSFWSSVPTSTVPCPTALGIVAAQELFTAIVVASSTDGGATWTYHTEDVCTLPELADALKPGREVGGNFDASIAIEPDGAVTVVYPTMSFTKARYTLQLIRSTDAGATWTAPVDLTPDAQHTTMPALTSDEHALRLVYVEIRDDGTGDTYYVESQDGAAMWSPPFKLSSASANLGRYPDIGPYRDPHIGDYISIDVAAGHIAAIWTDARRGDPAEIWMRAGMIG